MIPTNEHKHSYSLVGTTADGVQLFIKVRCSCLDLSDKIFRLRLVKYVIVSIDGDYVVEHTI